MAITYPARIELAQTPTPLIYCERMSEFLGVELWVKRDDMTGIEFSGNKIRKLEFLLADAIAGGADVVITGGGEQSNHCRATALAAARLGLDSRLLLRTEDPTVPPPTRGNILLSRLAGAEIVWIDHATWAKRDQAFADEAAKLARDGKSPYLIPEGGSNSTGSWGYIRCAEELSRQITSIGPEKATTVVYPCGSGGTGAGLIVGAKTLNWAQRQLSVAGVNVCNDAAYFVREIGAITSGFHAVTCLDSDLKAADIDIIGGYVGRGYAKSSPNELAVAVEFAKREAIIVDPVYTGKALFGLACELKRDPNRFGKRVIFVHTGGIFGLFPQAEWFESALSIS